MSKSLDPHNSTSENTCFEPCVTNHHCPIVAAGASAGGLEVFGQFFEQMPPESGIAFVLIQHLDRTHQTLMPELLSKHTSMPVLKAEEGMKVEANHVYVIPPNTSLSIKNCTLHVHALPLSADSKVIDVFFRSLAEDQNESVIGIVLSGTGSDGTLGIKAIKEHGGLTIAQNPESAKFEGMPRSAVTSGYVDFVLRVDEMPARILSYLKHIRETQHRKGVEALQQEVLQHLPQITTVLRDQTGHDFSRYKHSTLTRRIQRRMQVLYIEAAKEYLECLKSNSNEVNALFKDLLIGVTQFFRDPESFETLSKKVIPELFKDKGSDSQIRIWVPGCASGEEAYSFAMLLTEFAENLKDIPKIQIFATDLDTKSLEIARKARYSRDIEMQVPPEKLKRFFKKVEPHYELVDEIRELCVFSLHNVIKDPPFSRLDLISCRNLLIYLEADLQKKLLPLFHYALNPSGFLFLGPSENVASRSELFRAIDQKHRIFQRKPMTLHTAANVPLIDPGKVTKLQSSVSTSSNNPIREPNSARAIERVIVEQYAPASVVIDEQGNVVYFAGDTGKFLKLPAGSPSNKLISMARENLRLELRTLINRAISSRKEVIRENLSIKTPRENLQIDLIVRPLTELGAEAGLYIILFRELIPATNSGFQPAEDFEDHEHPIIKQLESELRTTREDLQTTIEELETSNEELKSANEELLSMNEELQSANEELQTSKEELQSANDELQRKIEETDQANQELRRAHQERAEYAAIVQNSDDAIIGKTLDGTITSWNLAAERMFGYRADEMIGQSILRIIPPELHEEEARILQRLRTGERVEHYDTIRLTRDGRQLNISLTSSPIRDQNGFIIGASKIARDITAQTAAVRASMLLAAIVDSSEDAIISKRLDGTITSWNKAAERLFGYTAGEMIGCPITKLFPADRLDEEPKIIARISAGQRVEHFETVRKTKSGKLIDLSLTISPVRDSDGRIIGASKIARDITEKKRTEEALRKAKDELEEKVNERTASLRETTEQLETFCYTVAHDLRSPLRAQQSFAQALIEEYSGALDDLGLEYAKRILNSAHRLDHLVQDLLSYSRISRSEIKYAPVDLRKVIQNVQDSHADEIANRGAIITQGPLHTVCAYEPTLNLIISNLIANALKFTEPGQKPEVHIWSEETAERVRLMIQDKGIGIPKEAISKIFGVFQRLHPIDQYPGTGIGLAIVQKGVERMGGRAGVESELGNGSTFWIELPPGKSTQS